MPLRLPDLRQATEHHFCAYTQLHCALSGVCARRFAALRTFAPRFVVLQPPREHTSGRTICKYHRFFIKFVASRALLQRVCVTAAVLHSARQPQHKVYPYLLRHKPVTHSNQVWAMDITYLRMYKGWVYLCALVNWYSRMVLAWGLSNTMDVQFCVQEV